ncbi:hypothetical protein [Catenibacterium sp.]|uniref:hypothetical protein n=1 Tax=Catenibacterium sp. TaxID=2049022 RepID=UPI003079822F
MKKNHAYLLSVILSCLLCVCTITSTTFAFSPEYSQNLSYDTILVNGKEIKVSTLLTDDERDKLVDLFKEIPTLSTDGIFTDFDQSITTIQDYNIPQQKKNNIKKSVIPTSKLALSIVKSDISTSSQKKYKIQSVAKWKSSPRVKNKDKFALAWAGNFAVSSYSSKAYWKTSTGQSTTVNSPLESIKPNAGIAYEYQCGNSDNSFSFNPWYVQINATLSRAKGNGNNRANIVAQYAHKTNGSGGISVSISPGSISFSISNGASYDTASPVSTTLSY